MSQLSKSATFHDFGEEPSLEHPGSPGENRDVHTPLASEKRGRVTTLSNWLGMLVSKRRSHMRPSMSMSLGMCSFNLIGSIPFENILCLLLQFSPDINSRKLLSLF